MTLYLPEEMESVFPLVDSEESALFSHQKSQAGVLRVPHRKCFSPPQLKEIGSTFSIKFMLR